jgi:hypothetical protein
LQAALDAAYAVDMPTERERIATTIEAACTYGDRKGVSHKPCRTCRNAARIARQGADQ